MFFITQQKRTAPPGIDSIRVRGRQPFLRGFYSPLRYGPCTQFINVSQRTLHIYWQFSAMSHAIHKIVSKRRCQSYFISRRSPHHGISKDSDLCASAHRCPHYAYARLIARVTLNLHRYDNAAVIGVHAADAAGVHDQAIFELYLIRKKLFDGLGAVRCITMGDHQCAVFGVSDFL